MKIVSDKDLLDAMVKCGGKSGAAAKKLGVSKRSLNRWISQRGMREELRSMRPRSKGGRPRGSASPKRKPVEREVVLRDTVVERECEPDGEYVSIADQSGTRVTLKFEQHGEALRLSGLLSSCKGHRERAHLAAEIMVATPRMRCTNEAILRVCGPEVAAKIAAEVEARMAEVSE